MKTSARAQLPIDLEAIQEATRRLSGQDQNSQIAIHTPLVFSDALSRQMGCRVWLKLESLQKTGSYKVRGAFNNMAQLPEEKRNLGVVTASAGNHAQGVALAASIFGIATATTVFVPIGTPKVKQDNTRGYGIEVIEVGENFDASREKAYEESAKSGRTFIEPFDDWNTIAGQGTVGAEILEDLPGIAGILAPVGGGGLIAGIAVATQAHQPGPRVIGVEAEGADSMIVSLEKGAATPLPHPPTTQIADGIKVRQPGERSFAVCQALLGREYFLTVPDIETVAAIADLMVYAKVIAEGAGAISVAALRRIQSANEPTIPPFKANENVAVVISGGNIDPGFSWRILYEQTVPNLLTLRLAMPDRPGELLRMLMPIYKANVNIIDVDVNRLDARPRMGERIVEVCVAVSTQSQADSLVKDLGDAGYRVLVSRWQDPELDRKSNMVRSQVLPDHQQRVASNAGSGRNTETSPIVIRDFRLTDVNGWQRPGNRFRPGESIYVETRIQNRGAISIPGGVRTCFFADQPKPIGSIGAEKPDIWLVHGTFPAKSGSFAYSSRPEGRRESRFRGDSRAFSMVTSGKHVARMFADSESTLPGTPDSKQQSVAYEICLDAELSEGADSLLEAAPVLVVNKQHPLPADYVPQNLHEPAVAGGKGKLLRDVASIALESMIKRAEQDGVSLSLLSAYRSNEDQRRGYLEYVADLGQKRAEQVSARAGHSEHQTGLAIDLGDANAPESNYRETFKDTHGGRWLVLNAADFGFILRYPEGKYQVTGFDFEPWHFRYIGVPLSHQIKQSRLTLEEFTGVTGGDYRRLSSEPLVQDQESR